MSDSVQVQLLKEHTHAGVKHASGAKLILRDEQAHWLIEAGVARPLAAVVAPGSQAVARSSGPAGTARVSNTKTIPVSTTEDSTP